MKRLMILLLALVPVTFCVSTVSAKVDKQVVVLYCDLHCQGCCDKIMKNIAFERGVKDIVCDLQSKTVTVTYDANKTDVVTLQKAFAKIGKPATTHPIEPMHSHEGEGQLHGEGEHQHEGVEHPHESK